MITWLLTVIGILSAVYLPAILKVWGMPTDYSMLYKMAHHNWFGFIETNHFLTIGRPLNALTSNLIYNTITNMGDLIWWRLIGFILLIIFLAVYAYYLRCHLKLERPWVALVVILVGLLPAATVFVMWTSVVLQGFFNLLIASGSYIALNHSRHSISHRLTWKILAFVTFMLSLFHYPPTSLIVFSFTFAHIVFEDQNSWNQVRRRIFSDLLFFGTALILYRLIERYVVTPFFLTHLNYQEWGGVYDMGFCQDFLTKMNSLFEVLCVSLAGPSHFIYGSSGAMIVLYIIGVTLLLTAVHLRTFNIFEQKKILVERLLWIILFFILANLLTILPKNVTFVIGYRLIFVSSLMGILMTVALLRWSFQKRFFYKTWIKIFVGLLVAASVCIVSTTLSDIVKNYTIEFNYINSKLAQVDLKQVKDFIFIKLPPQKTLIQRPLYYEYTYMITETHHYIPFILLAFHREGINTQKIGVHIFPSNYKVRLLNDSAVVLFNPAELHP